MQLGMRVGLCVRWGPSSPSSKGAQPLIFSPYPLRPMAAWIKMPLGMEVGVGPGDFVLDGDAAPPTRPTQPFILSGSINE